MSDIADIFWNIAKQLEIGCTDLWAYIYVLRLLAARGKMIVKHVYYAKWELEKQTMLPT